MENIFFIPLNWRFHLVMAFILASIVLLVSDSDNLAVFFIGKIIGLAMIYTATKLIKYWGDKGLIDEDITNIAE